LFWIQELEKHYGLTQARSEIVSKDERFQKFARNIVIATERDYDTEELNNIAKMPYVKEGDTTDLLNNSLITLLESQYQTDRTKLQCFGYTVKIRNNQKNLVTTQMTTQKQYFFKKEWDTVRTIIGDNLFRHIYTKYLFFERTSEGTLVQFAGISIFDFLNSRLARNQSDQEVKFSKSSKYNIKRKDDHYLNNYKDVMFNNMKSRTRIFYCTQLNRNNQFFKKHNLLQFKDEKSSIDRAEALFNDIFRFNRIRKDLKNNVISMLTHMLEKVKKFNFNYYLSKSCSLPKDWIERKKIILSHIDESRQDKAKYFEELFSYTIDNRGVTQFLNEFLYHCLPANFLEGRNRKNFQTKIKKFVTLNKHEMINKNLLLGKIDISKIDWLKFKSSNKHYYYFEKENRFVLWRIFRWIFEDVIVSLIR
jgi:hypothetical protein